MGEIFDNVKDYRYLLGENVVVGYSEGLEAPLSKEGVLNVIDVASNCIEIADEDGHSNVYGYADITYVKKVYTGGTQPAPEINLGNKAQESAQAFLDHMHDSIKYSNHKNTISKNIELTNKRITELAENTQTMMTRINDRLIHAEDFLSDMFGSKFKFFDEGSKED